MAIVTIALDPGVGIGVIVGGVLAAWCVMLTSANWPRMSWLFLCSFCDFWILYLRWCPGDWCGHVQIGSTRLGQAANARDFPPRKNKNPQPKPPPKQKKKKKEHKHQSQNQIQRSTTTPKQEKPPPCPPQPPPEKRKHRGKKNAGKKNTTPRSPTKSFDYSGERRQCGVIRPSP